MIADEFQKRKLANPAYSMRAFARKLGLNPTSLSQLLAQKRTLSARNVKRIVSALELNADTADALLREASARARTGSLTEYMEAQEDLLRTIEQGHCVPLLSLARAQNRAEPAWIAAKLGIAETAARRALDTLVELNFVRIVDGRMKRSAAALSSTVDMPSPSLARIHASTMDRARAALASVPLAERNFSAVTMPLSPAQIPRAKELLRKFMRRFSTVVERGDATEVYTLAMQFFPETNPKVKV